MVLCTGKVSRFSPRPLYVLPAFSHPVSSSSSSNEEENGFGNNQGGLQVDAVYARDKNLWPDLWFRSKNDFYLP